MRLQNDQILCDPSGCISSPLIHELAVYKQAHCSLFILRDDLLGPPFCGSKHRKYAGLFTHIIQNGFEKIIIPASLASNHLITSVDLCQKYGLKPLVFSKKPYGHLRSNAKAVLQRLAADEIVYDDHFIDKASEFSQHHPDYFLMPLGGFSKHAAISALSLGYDIYKFHTINPLDYIFLDAGTGLQAASCLIALQEMGYKGKVFVICMGSLDFDQVILKVCEWTNLSAPTFSIEVIKPKTAKSYGSTNRTLINFKNDFFEKTGIVLDDVYNAKSFYTLLELQKTRQVEGTCLIVHSGGTYSG